MPDPTDPRAVADDPSGIVQQMPEFVILPDPKRDLDELADLRAENERLREENALMAASLDEEERKCGLSTNGGMWRFWARQLREYHARRAALSPETNGGQDGA